jgi:hypothetical protein
MSGKKTAIITGHREGIGAGLVDAVLYLVQAGHVTTWMVPLRLVTGKKLKDSNQNAELRPPSTGSILGLDGLLK